MAKKKGIIKTNPLIPDGAGSREPIPTEDQKISKQASKNLKIQKSKNSRETKSASYYIDFDAQMAIDELQLKLRRSTGEKVSKSEIVEAAIKTAFLDFESTGEASVFFNQLKKIL